VERQYDQSADMWSFGCILFELLKYTCKDEKQSKKDFLKERYLFQGNSCFPLSPIRTQKGEDSNIIAHDDQLNLVIRALGIQTQ